VLTGMLSDTGTGMGYSQFNELLLLLGFDRVSHAFFQLLVDNTLLYESGSAIQSIKQLRDGVDRARTMALLFFGNVKFGFKLLSRNVDQLSNYHLALEPRLEETFSKRHTPVQPIDLISADETYYLGYIIARELEKKLEANPNDPTAKAEEELRKTIVERGKKNHDAYLASDHLDVYVATSMRKRHEYLQVNRLSEEIFSHSAVKNLKLRWFDPTQAYCKDRLDKGLAEALMLKRARCTLYLAQETDTLGKDSELASTLAQGKPVIAYLPRANAKFVDSLIETIENIYGQSETEIILSQLQIYRPELAWADPAVRGWLNDSTSMDISKAKEMLSSIIRAHYDKRADTLQNDHPLGIQVNLATGVANGVLVARTVEHCAELIRRIVTGTLQFRIDHNKELNSIYLREELTNSIFRVMTGDQMLANAFWNFYLQPSD
jgi:hypothetical protein